MFKRLLQEIIDAKSEEELTNIFYNENGVDMSYQREKITWKEYEMLAQLIDKLNDLYRGC